MRRRDHQHRSRDPGKHPNVVSFKLVLRPAAPFASELTSNLPLTRFHRYEAVHRIIIENGGSSRVLLAGFGTDLRQFQAIEKAVNAPVGCIYFHAKVEKRAERLARHALPGAKGQERVRRVLNTFREQLGKVIAYFEALNMYIKIQSTRSGRTEELVEAYFPRDTSSSIVLGKDGTEVYKVPCARRRRGTRDVAVQTADRPYSATPKVHRNLTGHSVAWRNNPSLVQGQIRHKGGGEAWGKVDSMLDGAQSTLATLGRNGQVGHYSAAYDGGDGAPGRGTPPPRPPSTVQYGKHKIVDPDLRTRNVILWLNHLQITKAGHPDDWDRNFSNGYLLGEVLAWYFPVDIQLSLFQANFTSAAKRHNWSIITSIVKKRKLPVSPEEIKELTDAVPLSCMVVLGKLHDALSDGGLGGEESGESGYSQSRQAHRGSMEASEGLWEQQQEQMVARTDRYIRGR